MTRRQSGAAAALGLDVGSTTTKCVAVSLDGKIVWELLESAEPRVEEQVRRVVGVADEANGGALLPLVATGYGRKIVARAIGRPARVVTEITCHARGVRAEIPGGEGGATLIDIGGQDSKAIQLGPRGDVMHFAMNDKCAAGTGRFLENTAARLGLSLAELGPAALEGTEEHVISSTCTVFAESEVVGLLARGASVEAIVRGLHRSLVQRVAALAKGMGLTGAVLLSGGVAANDAVPVFLAEELGRPVTVVANPQLAGAYGAALLGLD